MYKYRYRKTIVEALQWNGDLQKVHDLGLGYTMGGSKLKLKLDQGKVSCYPGDWIVRGNRGKFSVVRDEVFRETHEFWDDKSCNHGAGVAQS